MKAGFKWICEVSRCCGQKYVRKRLPGREFKITGQCCFVCGELLPFRDPDPVPVRDLEKYRERAERNRKKGLTAHGAARVRVPLTPAQAAYLVLKEELASAPVSREFAGCFRDNELNQRSAAAGRANKRNYAGFKMKEAA